MPSIDREQEVSKKSSTPAETASETPDEDVAPPKPPLPEAKMAELRYGWLFSAATDFCFCCSFAIKILVELKWILEEVE